MVKIVDTKSTHAFPDEALMILSIDPRIKKSIRYLKSAVSKGMIKAYSRGKVKEVYDRADLAEISEKLDNGHVLIDSAKYELVYDFEKHGKIENQTAG